ncbi:unnamed protein product, partial [Nesidiocoris tenuis]
MDAVHTNVTGTERFERVDTFGSLDAPNFDSAIRRSADESKYYQYHTLRILSILSISMQNIRASIRKPSNGNLPYHIMTVGRENGIVDERRVASELLQGFSRFQSV